MKINVSIDTIPWREIQGEQPRSRRRDDVRNRRPSLLGWLILSLMTILLLVPLDAVSKGKGGGGGGGGGGEPIIGVVVDYGDIFGDLMHILRDDVTGQPIFAQRWVEMPAELPGYGWGYCQIPISEYLVVTDPLDPEYGNYMLDAELNPIEGETELPFAPYSCDVDPLFDEMTVEVDYFGRLNASRTQERNQRMHFNETISNIKQAERLKLGPGFRLMMGYECVEFGDCLWSTVDSPMENMAMYRRMMKYGHLSTSPTELDLWWHGDPKLPTPYHPALDADDFQKFRDAGLDNLLPAGNCFNGDEYISSCAETESLTLEDFNSAAKLLGASGGKEGRYTVHLVQYLNRFLRITQSTEFADSTPDWLVARYKDCWPDGWIDPWTQGEEPPEGYDLQTELVYGDCTISDVHGGIPNYDDFSNVQELFMNFGFSLYHREDNWDNDTAKADVILESSSISWLLNQNTPLIEWIPIPNPATPFPANARNFANAAEDAGRAIEYIHNYDVPDDLYCKYDVSYCD